MGESETIPVWTEIDTETKAALPRFGKSGTTALGVVQVEKSVLAHNLRIFLAEFEPILEEQPEDVAGYYIEEIEISLAISATGGIELIGKLDAGAQAGITVKLKRKQNNS